jgi:hypothetical protein
MEQGTDADHNHFTRSWDSGQEQHNRKGRRLPRTSPPLRPEIIEKLARAVYPSFAMVAGMQRDVLTPLKDGPMSVEHLAAALAVHRRKLRPLLYALVAAGLLTVQDERCANPPEAAHFLVRGQPAYRGATDEGLLLRWHATLHTAESIRTGIPPAKWDYAAMPPDQRAAWYRGMHDDAVAAARPLMAQQEVSSARHLLEVGGGSGGLALTIAARYPPLQAPIVDLATVPPSTQRYVAEAGLTERLHVMTADVVQGPRRGAFDVAVLLWCSQLTFPFYRRGPARREEQHGTPGKLLK